MFSNIFPKSVFHALISNIRPCSSRLPVPLQPRLLAGLPTTSSATSLSARASRDPLAALRFSPRTIHYFPSRQFVSSVRRPVRYGGYSYRRFDQGQGPQGAPGTPLVKVLLATAGGVGVLYIYNLETVEATGRRRFNCVSHSLEQRLGQEQYHAILNDARGRILPENHPIVRSVNRVLQRLIPEAPIEGANWKVHVIHDDSTANAFVLPGGKVFVFTGILGICGNEDGLAAVLAHEISHVIAHHSGERMSHNIVVSGLVLLSSIVFDVTNLASMLLNFGLTLPNSRVQEAEADEMGLMMMAKACFDPEAAVRLWARMQQVEKVNVPQFMSTHPTNYNRMEALRDKLYKAESMYESNGCHIIKGQLPGFRQGSSTSGWHGTPF